VVKARATSNPWAAGSNPAGGESRRSSVVEQEKKSCRMFPPQRLSIARSGCAGEIPGWWRAELLRLDTTRGAMIRTTMSISRGSMGDLSGQLGLRTSGGYAAAGATGSTSAGTTSKLRRTITAM